jgi:competence protein ComEA
MPAAPSAPPPAVVVAWPRSAQLAVAFLLGIVATLIGLQAWGSLRWSSRPSELERNPVLTYRIDLNHAPRAELLQLPGVGAALAERIEGRRPYRDPQQLREVAGIGPATYERLRPLVYVSDQSEVVASDEPDEVKQPGKSMAGAGKKKEPGKPIDINRAAEEELQKLPGIGPVKARAIMDTRQKRPFKSVEDLRRVPGIGPKILEQLKPHITIGSDPGPVASAE